MDLLFLHIDEAHELRPEVQVCYSKGYLRIVDVIFSVNQDVSQLGPVLCAKGRHLPYAHPGKRRTQMKPQILHQCALLLSLFLDHVVTCRERREAEVGAEAKGILPPQTGKHLHKVAQVLALWAPACALDILRPSLYDIKISLLHPYQHHLMVLTVARLCSMEGPQRKQGKPVLHLLPPVKNLRHLRHVYHTAIGWILDTIQDARSSQRRHHLLYVRSSHVDHGHLKAPVIQQLHVSLCRVRLGLGGIYMRKIDASPGRLEILQGKQRGLWGGAGLADHAGPHAPGHQAGDAQREHVVMLIRSHNFRG